MPSAILQALYEGRRGDAESAATGPLDVLEAAALGRVEVLRDLLAHEPDAVSTWSDDGFTPLHYACFFGTPEAVALLVEAGADVEVPSRNEMAVRPLNSAAAGPHALASARLLLEAGADPNARQASGHTALDAATLQGADELAAVLRAAGASARAVSGPSSPRPPAAPGR